MADLGLVFTLMLVALAFVVVGVFFIVYIMIVGEREKRRLAERRSMPSKQLHQECPHYLGYLNGYPVDQLVPEECHGCANAAQCKNSKSPEAAALAQEPAES